MVAARSDLREDDRYANHGIPIFLDQLTYQLRLEQGAESLAARIGLGIPEEGTDPAMGDVAALHGRDLLKQGFTLEQVVRAYGDVCQAVTNLAFETGAPIEVDEFRTFNRCLDNAIAGAVTEYSYAQTMIANEDNFHALSERLGPLAHELRNYLQSATLAFGVIKAGKVGATGATGQLIDTSLAAMRHLIERSLTDVRVTAAIPPRFQSINLRRFFIEAETSASLDPASRNCRLVVEPPLDDTIEAFADPEMLSSAVANLLQNAFKFTKHGTDVRMGARANGNRIQIEVRDHCGGIPVGALETLMTPFVQGGIDRSGLGLGLSISRRAVEANHGTLSVRDLPGSGCIFTIDLPRSKQTTFTPASPAPRDV